jgi:hypothetical protein
VHWESMDAHEDVLSRPYCTTPSLLFYSLKTSKTLT